MTAPDPNAPRPADPLPGLPASAKVSCELVERLRVECDLDDAVATLAALHAAGAVTEGFGPNVRGRWVYVGTCEAPRPAEPGGARLTEEERADLLILARHLERQLRQVSASNTMPADGMDALQRTAALLRRLAGG